MTKVLLVIDVQQGLCEGEDAVFDGPGLIGRINQLTVGCHAANVPVIFIQHESTAGYLERGSRAWQLAQGLKVEDSDICLRKTAADAFHKTVLLSTLQELGATELLVCGMHTEFCVDTTVRRALALGYPVTLFEDGHSSAGNRVLSPQQVIAHHNATLSNISSFGPRVALANSSHWFEAA